MKKIAIVFALAFAFTTEIAFLTAIAHQDQAAPTAIATPITLRTQELGWAPVTDIDLGQACQQPVDNFVADPSRCLRSLFGMP
jgi:hypothetical protein